ncbi:hypothetical protein Bbelb_245660 [Branchiostoma belcheri]|nr:hypothetical protein Bbelb_245660 [Branchiostoma belcheri]
MAVAVYNYFRIVCTTAVRGTVTGERQVTTFSDNPQYMLFHVCRAQILSKIIMSEKKGPDGETPGKEPRENMELSERFLIIEGENERMSKMWVDLDKKIQTLWNEEDHHAYSVLDEEGKMNGLDEEKRAKRDTQERKETGGVNNMIVTQWQPLCYPHDGFTLEEGSLRVNRAGLYFIYSQVNGLDEDAVVGRMKRDTLEKIETAGNLPDYLPKFEERSENVIAVHVEAWAGGLNNILAKWQPLHYPHDGFTLDVSALTVLKAGLYFIYSQLKDEIDEASRSLDTIRSTNGAGSVAIAFSVTVVIRNKGRVFPGHGNVFVQVHSNCVCRHRFNGTINDKLLLQYRSRDKHNRDSGFCGISRGSLRDIPREIAGYPVGDYGISRGILSGGLSCPAYRVAKKLGARPRGLPRLRTPMAACQMFIFTSCRASRADGV